MKNSSMAIQCTQCQFEPGFKSSPYICPVCGGHFDFSREFPFDSQTIDAGQPGIWRYRSSFGLPDEVEPISLQEGGTPLIWEQVPQSNRFVQRPGDDGFGQLPGMDGR